MPYVDGFLIPVPKAKLAAYKRMAAKSGVIWKRHGALDYKECVLDDAVMKTPDGDLPSMFPKMALAKRGETVVYSFIVYKSKAHRNQVNKRVMADPDMLKMMTTQEMPFDLKRFGYAGFKVMVDR